jgi:hypothetical protein
MKLLLALAAVFAGVVLVALVAAESITKRAPAQRRATR